MKKICYLLFQYEFNNGIYGVFKVSRIYGDSDEITKRSPIPETTDGALSVVVKIQAVVNFV
jgi:hypothetical protein